MNEYVWDQAAWEAKRKVWVPEHMRRVRRDGEYVLIWIAGYWRKAAR